jgi:hypothetical protein
MEEIVVQALAGVVEPRLVDRNTTFDATLHNIAPCDFGNRSNKL